MPNAIRVPSIAGLALFAVLGLWLSPLAGQSLASASRVARLDATPAAPTSPRPEAPHPVTAGRMSCGTARLISAPLGAGAGALGTFVLYEMLAASMSANRTPTAGPDVRPAGMSDRSRLVLVGGTLGLILGIAAPPVARDCWISIPGRPGSESASATRDVVPRGRLGISQPRASSTAPAP
jgi:hypothetical protein